MKNPNGHGTVYKLPAVHALRQQKKMILAEKLASSPGEYQDNNLVFPTSLGRPQDPTELGHRFKRLARRIGISKARFHDLRHTFATMMLGLDIHPKVVQEMLGHETISITMDTYSHVLKGMQEEAVDKANKYLVDRDGGKMAGNTKNHP